MTRSSKKLMNHLTALAVAGAFLFQQIAWAFPNQLNFSSRPSVIHTYLPALSGVEGGGRELSTQHFEYGVQSVQNDLLSDVPLLNGWMLSRFGYRAPQQAADLVVDGKVVGRIVPDWNGNSEWSVRVEYGPDQTPIRVELPVILLNEGEWTGVATGFVWEQDSHGPRLVQVKFDLGHGYQGTWTLSSDENGGLVGSEFVLQKDSLQAKGVLTDAYGRWEWVSVPPEWNWTEEVTPENRDLHSASDCVVAYSCDS